MAVVESQRPKGADKSPKGADDNLQGADWTRETAGIRQKQQESQRVLV